MVLAGIAQQLSPYLHVGNPGLRIYALHRTSIPSRTAVGRAQDIGIHTLHSHPRLRPLLGQSLRQDPG